MAAIEAVVQRTESVLAGAPPPMAPARDALVYDVAWDEEARLASWRARVEETKNLPPVLAAALALQAWQAMAPLQHTPWLGGLLAAAVLRARGKTRAHLACLNSGWRAISRERRHAPDCTAKLMVAIEAVGAAAEAGLKDHDRWLLARRQLERKFAGRRATSKLPALIDLILATPLVSAGMIAARLGVTPRAAQGLVAELGLREMTGRGRYRAWGII